MTRLYWCWLIHAALARRVVLTDDINGYYIRQGIRKAATRIISGKMACELDSDRLLCNKSP